MTDDSGRQAGTHEQLTREVKTANLRLAQELQASEVSPAMVQAGVAVFREWEASDQPSLKVLVQTLYLAMAAQAPALPLPDGSHTEEEAEAMSLELNNALSQPQDGSLPDAAVLSAHRRFQNYNSVVIVDCTDAKQLSNDLSGGERRFYDPVRQ
jgi:hypothetical protein